MENGTMPAHSIFVTKVYGKLHVFWVAPPHPQFVETSLCFGYIQPSRSQDPRRAPGENLEKHTAFKLGKCVKTRRHDIV
jgi:hypothetical protein